MDYTPIAEDDFERADGGFGSNWLSVNPDNGGSGAIVGGRAVSATSGPIASGTGATNVWVGAGAGSFTANQRVRVIIDLLGNLSNAYYNGACVRMSSDLNAARDLKGFIIENDGSGTYTTRLFKIVNGTAGYQSLASASLAWSNLDEAWLDAVGDDLVLFRGGSAVLSALGDTDLPTGVPGFIVAGQTTNAAINWWQAGNLSEAAPGVALNESGWYPSEPQTNPLAVSVWKQALEAGRRVIAPSPRRFRLMPS